MPFVGCAERKRTMDDLISRKALLAEYDRVHIGEPGKARKLIEDAPTVDAVEVVHGRWEIIMDDYDCEMMMCSVCRSEFYDGDNDTVDHLHNYCPNCGAKMQ